ncbi:hypothetical protein [Streptomyces sp. NPDC051079]|uniref:hypothetical protein n=1 Tax=Streptomyces sp. NPDC051079 TaxID=3155043 RepID=UPI00344E03BA
MTCDRCGEPITGDYEEVVPPSERAARPTVYTHLPLCDPSPGQPRRSPTDPYSWA